MLVRLVVAALAIQVAPGHSPAQEVDRNGQIAHATRAAPPSMRDGATVLGYGGVPRDGDVLTTLREGSNGLMCLADDPGEKGFHTACYHSSLEDYMVLGRRLRGEGRSRSEIMDARYAALESGQLMMPVHAMLYSVSAASAPDAGGTLEGERKLSVVYVPGATGEELGLPTRPDGGGPWLMLAGTPWAHIMISR